jgi:hypothetical protein
VELKKNRHLWVTLEMSLEMNFFGPLGHIKIGLGHITGGG